MNPAKRLLVHLAFLSLCCSISADVASETGGNHEDKRIIRSNADVLVMQAVSLDEDTVNELVNILDTNTTIRQLWLVDMPGGNWVQTARLAWRAQFLDVYAVGLCMSGCARVALAGRTLTMVSDQRNEKPAVLAIHGTFSKSSGQWGPTGLRDLDFYADRLPVIPRQDIEAALSYTDPALAGLFISHRSDRFGKDSGAVHLCERLPTTCRKIDVQVSDLRISKADGIVPLLERDDLIQP